MPPKLNIFHFLKDRRDQFLYFRNGAEVNLWIWVKTQLRPKVYYWTKCGESLNHRSADFLMKFHCFFSFCKGLQGYVVQLLLCVQKEHIQLKVSFFFVWKLSRKVFWPKNMTNDQLSSAHEIVQSKYGKKKNLANSLSCLCCSTTSFENPFSTPVSRITWLKSHLYIHSAVHCKARFCMQTLTLSS